MHAISKIIINSIENNKKIIIPKYLKDKLTISEGYYIQNEINNFFSINNIFKGWKIGCTTPVMQKYLGIPNPCLGKVRAKNLFEGDTKLKFENFSNPGVECEIAVILSDEYDYKKKYDNLEDLISKVVSSIEVVDDRWPNYKEENTPLLIADNFFSSTIVHSIGVEKIDLNSLKNLKGKMKVNNKIIGNGEGKDILEDPLNALKWFLEFNFEQNNAPQSGDLISLGSLVKTYWVSKNDTITVDIEELGKIEAKFI